MKNLTYSNLPLILYLAYALFVIGSLVLGPIAYKDINYWVVLSYLGAFLLLFAVGYLRGARVHFGREITDRLASGQDCYRSVRFLLGLLLLWGVISSFFGWYQLIVSGASLDLSALGDSYRVGYKGYVRGTASVDGKYVFNIVDQAAVSLAVILGIANYRFLRRTRAVMLIFIVASYVLVNLMNDGKQKYLGDVAIFMSVAWAIRAAAQNRKLRIRTAIWTALIAATTFVVFCEILGQRYAGAGIVLSNIAAKAHPLMAWDVNSVVFDIFGDRFGLAVGILLSYFSNGLYGLYLSLTLPFQWTYFLGSSYSVGRVAEIALGQDGLIFTRTYPYRVGEVYGWGMDKWHTAFAWLASDFSFTGVLILTPLFAALYARLWRESVNSSNAYAAPLFIYLSLGLIFSFANNQMVHAMSGVIVLAFLFIQWLRNSRKGRRSTNRVKTGRYQMQMHLGKSRAR